MSVRNTIPANAEGTPKFDCSAIMKKAWERYRRIRQQYADWQIERGIVDASFSACLASAWRIAKQEREEAIKAARVSQILQTPAGERLRALQGALEGADRLSFRYSAAARRAAIKAEMSAIMAH